MYIHAPLSTRRRSFSRCDGHAFYLDERSFYPLPCIARCVKTRNTKLKKKKEKRNSTVDSWVSAQQRRRETFATVGYINYILRNASLYNVRSIPINRQSVFVTSPALLTRNHRPRHKTISKYSAKTNPRNIYLSIGSSHF